MRSILTLRRDDGVRMLQVATVMGLCAAAAARPPNAEAQAIPVRTEQVAQANDQALAPGDIIRLVFWRDQNLSGDFAVDETGRVVLPFLGVRLVVDVPAGHLKEQLLEQYRGQLRNQDVQVTLLRRVRVLGAVNTPGLYHVDPTMTIGDVVALAGGAADDGDLEKVRIQRTGLDQLLDVDAGTVLDRLQSGDQILIQQKSWVSRNGRYLIGGILSVTAIILTQRRYR